jgi:putative tryptophan/tyrosine transport system substrate-binding protein
MRRRDFIALAGATAAWPERARAQARAAKVPVVGVLWHAANAEQEDIYLSIVRQAFHDLGYIEGKNIVLEHRFPAEQPERFRALAQELVELKPDVIMAASVLGAIELKRATATIPIVFVVAADPVGFGLAASLSHPGGNVTGLSLMSIDLSGKRLALLKEAVPNLSRVGLLIDRTDPFREKFVKANQASAEALGMSISVAEVGSADDVEPAFAKFAEASANGVICGPGGLLFVERDRIGAAALAHKLPAIAIVAEEVPPGLLMSYGQDFPDYFRRAPSFVDRILKGANPADLPVEQPTKFKLVVNLKAAKRLGVTVPQSLLLTADETIE